MVEHPATAPSPVPPPPAPPSPPAPAPPAAELRASPAHPSAAERARAAAIVAALPLAERIRLVSGASFWTTHEVPGQVPSVMLTDGPHGLRKQAGNLDHVGLSAAVPATCFPPAVTLGSTWDVDLLEAVGAALGREAAAEDVAVLLGPGLNLKRHPRGGRSFEYLAEDPVLSGLLAAALVRGIQSQGVVACVKHYAANNQETNRMVLDAIIDERTLHELYLRGFELAVQRGAPAALMTAYNLVNGQYAGESALLMREVLRGAWGYDGLVVSDWGAVDDRVAGLAVGLDLEMPGGSGAFDAEVAAAVADGRLAQDALDAAAARVAAVALHWAQVRAAQHEPDADHEAHHALARRAAAAGCVLLQNDGVLPLRPGASVALIGAFADEPRYQGAGSSQVTPTRVDALRPALAGELGQALRYAAGYDPLTGASTPALMAQAAAAARTSEVAIVLVGLPSRLESEGFDRADLRLPPDHEHLLEVVLDANPRTVVVVVGGGVVELPWAERPAAILAAWLGGQAGGSALADVLLGVVEPGGRLAESIPVDGAALPASRNFPGQPRQVQYRERHLVGYRFHDTAQVPARFPFGHGLGYTTWQVDDVRLTGAGTDRTVHARLTNTGSRPGSQVLQVYVGREGASAVARPAKELRGFAKVHLDAGASTEVTIELDRRCFTVWDVATKAWVVEAGTYAVLVGTSSTQLTARLPVLLESDDVLAPEPPVADLVANDAEFTALLGHPVPPPAPVRPFTRTTTIGELAASRAGRGLAALMQAGITRRVSGGEAIDDRMLTAVVQGMPLRGFVQMAGGALTFGHLDRVLAALNGDVRGLLRRGDRPGERDGAALR